jgi:hypothetical protein
LALAGALLFLLAATPTRYNEFFVRAVERSSIRARVLAGSPNRDGEAGGPVVRFRDQETAGSSVQSTVRHVSAFD